MKLTLKIQVFPDTNQKQLLLGTMRAFNAAASHAAKVGFDSRVFSQPAIHARCYRELRERFGLSSQMAVRAIGKAVECFSRDKKCYPVFKPLGAMIYDERMMGFKGMDRVSLLTLKGRQIIPIIFGKYQGERFDRLNGQCDLIFKNDKFYLMCSIDLPDKAPIEVKKFLGVDMGVAKLITTSDGQHVSGSVVEDVRVRYFNIHRSLGRKMAGNRRTRKNARRAMKRIGNREARFRSHTNHVISKTLITFAKDTNRGIAIEELTGIRDRTRFRKGQRAKMGGWAFAQLRDFIAYKGKLYGVSVVAVDPRNTSRECNKCGYCAKTNRKSQSEFVCGHCQHTTNADLNAAINIARRGCINQPKVTQQQRIVAA